MPTLSMKRKRGKASLNRGNGSRHLYAYELEALAACTKDRQDVVKSKGENMPVPFSTIPCSNSSVEVTATQVLEAGPNGKIIQQSFTTP